MDDKLFADLLQSVREMKAHMHGKSVGGAKVSKLAEPEPRAIREFTKLSQSEFAQLVGVPVKTLQNWEQKRTRPAGPARALLRAIAKDPRAVLKALAG
jgi:putative transcriptional regulator